MWLAIESLYMGVEAHVLYSDSLSRKFDVSPVRQNTFSLHVQRLFILIAYLSS